MSMIGVPVFAAVVVWMNRHQLQDERVERKFGQLYGDFRQDNRMTMLWECYDMCRRIILASLLIVLGEDAGAGNGSSSVTVLF
jgi:hypothetical protein